MNVQLRGVGEKVVLVYLKLSRWNVRKDKAFDDGGFC